MSIRTFDPALWSRHIPTGGDYGQHVPTPSGSVLLDGSIYAQALVPDVDSIQQSPAAVKVIMERFRSAVCGKAGEGSVVRLAELEAYTTNDGQDALKARFAYSQAQ